MKEKVFKYCRFDFEDIDDEISISKICGQIAVHCILLMLFVGGVFFLVNYCHSLF